MYVCILLLYSHVCMFVLLLLLAAYQMFASMCTCLHTHECFYLALRCQNICQCEHILIIQGPMLIQRQASPVSQPANKLTCQQASDNQGTNHMPIYQRMPAQLTSAPTITKRLEEHGVQ